MRHVVTKEQDKSLKSLLMRIILGVQIRLISGKSRNRKVCCAQRGRIAV